MKNLITPPRGIASLLATVALALGVQDVSYGQPPAEEGKIYWTEEKDLGWIQRADLNGAYVERVLTTEIRTGLQMDPIFLLAVDSYGGKIYWTERNSDSGKGTIRRANLNGGNVETLVKGEDPIIAMALDPFGGKMYWAEWDTETSAIQRADLDGSNVETLVTGIEAYVSGIVLDAYVWAWEGFFDLVPASKMYWTEFGTGTIRRADPDGSNIETLLTGIGHPVGIALYGLFQDVHFPIEQKMYWSDWDTDTIRRSNLDGSNIETVITGEEGSRIAFALEGWTGRMYWTELSWESDTAILRRADVDGSNVEVITEIETPLVLAVDSFRYDGTLYWSRWDSSTIQRSYGEPISLGMEGPGSIAVDTTDDMLYWLDKRTRSIRRANLDGTNVEDLVTGLEDAKDIALDLVAGKMYWTEQGMGAIRRADLDGSNVENLLTDIENPGSIALDVLEKKMYWTVRGASRFPDSGIIQRSNLDGSNVETLLAGLRDPMGIALDHVAGKMYYWVGSSWSRGIYRSNLDGSSSEVLVTGYLATESELKGPVEIVLDIVEGKMYWTDKGAGVIRRTDLDGANVEDIITGLTRPLGIALDVPPPATPPHTARISRTVVEAIVQGDAVESLTIEFARSVSTGQSDYAWSAVTDAAGHLALNIDSRDATEVSGFYEARARNEEGEIVGRWDNILLNESQRQILVLTLDGGVREIAIERLGEPNPDPCSNGIAVPYPKFNHDLVADCRALLAFRNSWDWWDLMHWDAGTFIDYWTGVEVRNSRVRGFVLSDLDFQEPAASISGPFSPELSRLTALEVLSLPRQGLKGPIPPEFGQLTQLTGLDLSSNELTGPIPPELGRLSQLTYLNLYDTQLTGPIPPELGQLSQLITLDLSWNELTGPIPSELGRLSQLTVLNFSSNQLTGPVPPELGQLSQLTDLNLENNQLTGPIPSELGQLSQLKRVYLSSNQFTCVPEALAKWADNLPICDATESTITEADFDGDGATNFTDFFLFAEHFGSSDTRFDLNASGTVDFADFFLFAEHFAPSARAKLVAMAQELIGLPDSSQLQQNAPNPFNSQTVLSYFLHVPSPARLEVFALTGQRVAVLHQGPQQAGYHRLRWNGHDDAGHPVASGMYLYRLVTDEAVLTRKLMLLR